MSKRILVPTLIALLFLALFVVAGILVRQYVSAAFVELQHVHEVQNLAGDVLKLQLDQETGIRGLAATSDRKFLEPYLAARADLVPLLDRLAAELVSLQLNDATAAIVDARSTSTTWTRDVAVPVIDKPRQNSLRVQRFGKRLMDRFRGDLAIVGRAIATREAVIDTELRRAIDRINVFVGIVVLVLTVAAIAYAVQQVRAAARLAEQEQIAEDERRQRAELAAAYETEKRIAETLQTAFTQRPLPAHDTLRFSASYVPAAEDAKVGGDWYDVMALPGNRVLFAIGDVTGHGIEAAVTMNRARQSVISSALLDDEPGSVLARVNLELVERNAPLVTAIAGIADAEHYEFIYAGAGHPPPVLLEPGRAPRLLDFGSLPLGASDHSRYPTKRVQSVPGATLVLYTDGAVEHTRDVIEGEALLLRAVADAVESGAENPATFIHEAIFKGRAAGDDVAILTIGFAVNRRANMFVSSDEAHTGNSGGIKRSAGVVGVEPPVGKLYDFRPRRQERLAS